jgi:hypothetical protein
VGASASFGFVASGTGRPLNCTVNGVACGGGVQSDDFGVDPFSVQILQSAVRNGVRVSIVNPMVMDFSSSRPWGDALVAAAASTLNQMRGIFTGVSDANLRRMLGRPR